MSRIYFKPLPDESTPATAERINGLLNGEESIEKVLVGSVEGKNLFDKDDVYKYNYGFNDSGEFSNTLFNIYNKIKVKPSTTYYISRTTTDVSYGFRIASYKANGTKINYYNNITNANFSYTTPSETDYILISCASNGIDTNIQLEIGDKATDYNPHMKYGYNEDTNMGKLIVEKISGKNLYDPIKYPIKQGLWSKNSNSFGTNNAGYYVIVPVEGGKTYSVSKKYTYNDNNRFNFWVTVSNAYPEDGVSTVIPFENYREDKSFSIDIPSNGKYLFLGLGSSLTAEEQKMAITELQVELGSQVTQYQDFNTTQMGNIVVDDIKCKNLFDKNTITIVQGSFSYINNSETTDSTRIRSNFFKIQPNTTYTISINSIIGEIGIVYKQNDNTTIIQGIGESTNNNYYTFTTPANAYYMRFRLGNGSNIKTAGIDYNIQIEKGSEATSYTSYKDFDSTAYILWTNPSPTSEFAGQTITLNDAIENYKYYEVIYKRINNASTYSSSGKMPVPLRIRHDIIDGGIGYSRAISSVPVGTSVAFGNGEKFATYGSASTTNNQYLVPYQILGYK